ncbi:MAG: cupredoxin domain-containing protein [Candidatus Nitrosotenuis sp.]|jgi:plastocyanin
MKTKPLILIGATIAAIIVGLVLISAKSNTNTEQRQDTVSGIVVTIAMSSSRPGCEKTGCYLPTTLVVNSGDTVTWVNKDRGLHTVTTGYYDVPDGVVESKQVAPEDTFSFTFEKSGEFHYYCRLHPWMEGTVIVN